MKVAIISFSPPYTIPYLQYYLKMINKDENMCDIIFWDRDGDFQSLDNSSQVQYFPYRYKTGSNKPAKYFGYIFVIKFIRKMLKNNTYDKVFFLQTHAAVACRKILLKKYKKKYIVDIRDFTLEKFFLYRKWEKTVIENSYTTVISSEGYRKFLPEFNYTLVHNYTDVPEDSRHEVMVEKDRELLPIEISFIGSVRFIKMAKKQLVLFKNDNRFHLSFIGKGAELLKKFCDANDIYNVTIEDRFPPEKTVEYYKKCAIVNNYYGNKSRYLDYALSNKLYYSALFHLPLLVNSDTYSSEIASEYGFGITWDLEEKNSIDVLYNQYKSINFEMLSIGCEKFINKVIADNHNFENIIGSFLMGV